MRNYPLRWLLIILSLSGCSVVNFSANYYDLPPNYRNEISELWQKLKAQSHFKNDYAVSIISGRDSRRLKGIPAISNNTVLLPEEFIKYCYQNYYYDRLKIFTSVIVHEISHPELNLPSRPPKQHFQADLAAIKMLGDDKGTAYYYYKSLYVVKNYWFARKGMAGHTLNASWNALNGASLLLGGPAYFADFFATDLSERMNMIAKHYSLRSPACFERSQQGR
jgi:hypothetical protein